MKLRFDRRYLISVLLAVPVVVLILAIGIEIGWGRRINLPIPQPKPQKSNLSLAALQTEFVLPPLDQSFMATLERPLLTPTRRPSPPPPPPVVPPPPKPTMRKNQFTLVGVILTKGKNVALLREIANGKVLRVEQGKEINGILVAAMEKEKVTLTQWDDREELTLKIQPGQKIPQPMQAGMPGQPPGAGPAPVAGQGPAPSPVPPTVQMGPANFIPPASDPRSDPRGTLRRGMFP